MFDSLLFCYTTIEEGQNLMHILGQYEEASSQAINKQKTSFFFSKNIGSQIKREIQHLLGTRILTNCEKYLGLPTVGGKSKVNTFRDL